MRGTLLPPGPFAICLISFIRKTNSHLKMIYHDIPVATAAAALSFYSESNSAAILLRAIPEQLRRPVIQICLDDLSV